MSTDSCADVPKAARTGKVSVELLKRVEPSISEKRRNPDRRYKRRLIRGLRSGWCHVAGMSAKRLGSQAFFDPDDGKHGIYTETARRVSERNRVSGPGLRTCAKAKRTRSPAGASGRGRIPMWSAPVRAEQALHDRPFRDGLIHHRARNHYMLYDA